MNEPTLLPYNVPRNLDQDAWSLYEATSVPYYELCAARCDEFAHFFNKLVTGHQAHGMGRVDYWVSCYLAHAENIRRSIQFVKLAGDYMPMIDFLGAPSSDFRGLIENSFGYETRDEWDGPFHRMSYACGMGASVLRNNQRKGLNWINRDSLSTEDRRLLDDSSGSVGNDPVGIKYLIEYEIATPPDVFPAHSIDRSIKAAPGDRCPRSGVWAPAQWADEGAGNFSLAFCIEGRAMQPAYEILGLEKHVISEAEPEHGLEEFASYSPKTKAVETTWYFVEKASPPEQNPAGQAFLRLRCEANKPCPQEGYWFTPAHAGSRRHFRQGEPMPEFKSDYGLTIWQWDEHQ